MALNRIETTVLEASVRVRYGDNADPLMATETMEFQFPLAALKQPNGGGRTLDDPELQLLGVIEAAVLLHAQNAINAEIQRLRGKKDQ